MILYSYLPQKLSINIQEINVILGYQLTVEPLHIVLETQQLL